MNIAVVLIQVGLLFFTSLASAYFIIAAKHGYLEINLCLAIGIHIYCVNVGSLRMVIFSSYQSIEALQMSFLRDGRVLEVDKSVSVYRPQSYTF